MYIPQLTTFPFWVVAYQIWFISPKKLNNLCRQVCRIEVSICIIFKKIIFGGYIWFYKHKIMQFHTRWSLVCLANITMRSYILQNGDICYTKNTSSWVCLVETILCSLGVTRKPEYVILHLQARFAYSLTSCEHTFSAVVNMYLFNQTNNDT